MDELDFLNKLLPPLTKPELGIGWTPDRFRISIWYPNGPWKDDQVLTWEQATEKARRLVEGAHDPVFSVTISTVDPLRELEGRSFPDL